MTDLSRRVRDDLKRLESGEDAWDATIRRVEHRRRRRAYGAAGIAMALTITLIVGLIGLTGRLDERPAVEPTPSPSSLPPVGHVIDISVGEAGVWLLTCDVRCGDDGRDSTGSAIEVDRETGEPGARIPVGRPHEIVVGRDAVWVVSFWDSRVIRIDPETRAVVAEAELELPFEVVPGDRQFLPTGLVAAPQAIWAASARGALARIHAGSGAVQDYTEIGVNGDLMTADPTGETLWLARQVGELVARDATSGSVMRTITLADGQRRLGVADLVAGPTSILVRGTWAVPSSDGAGHTNYTLTDEHALLLVDAGSGAVTSVASRSGGRLFFESGRFWILTAAPSLEGIDPQSGKSLEEVSLPSKGWVAVGLGAAWVTQADGTVARVELHDSR